MKSVIALACNLDQVMWLFAAVSFDVLNMKEKKQSEI